MKLDFGGGNKILGGKRGKSEAQAREGAWGLVSGKKKGKNQAPGRGRQKTGHSRPTGGATNVHQKNGEVRET